MKIRLAYLLVTLQLLPCLGLLVKAPQKSQALVEQKDVHGVKLIPSLARKQWLHKKHDMRVHMLADEPAQKETHRKFAVRGCLACTGHEVTYGKYRSVDGDQTDNSYYLFKDPATIHDNKSLPIAIHFHAGGFYSGGPWRTENDEIKAYLRAGFAVVSVGYRLTTQKYFYEAEDGENKTEELIRVTKDGKLSLDKNETMEDYQVKVGKQEFITKYVYDATELMQSLIRDADKYKLDIHRIVFIGESSGGAAIQYLTWVYHRWHQDDYTPRGIVYHNAQLNYPVNNMLAETWGLFSETMGPQVKLADVMSQEACPTIVGNTMCNSAIGNISDYDLCNEEWNERSLKEFCGEALKTHTLGQARARQVWKAEDEESKGMEKLWYASENMQKHMPSGPFYIYVENSMNGTSPIDVAHHSVFALNFAKYAEMGKHGGHQYTVYYTDFAHMAKEDRGTKRMEVMREPSSLHLSPAAAAPSPGSAPAPGYEVAPAPAPGPAPGPAYEVASALVFNYLSTHGWREDVAEARDIEPASVEERVLYACLAVGIGPFAAVENNTRRETESGALLSSLPSFSIALAGLITFLSHSF